MRDPSPAKDLTDLLWSKIRSIWHGNYDLLTESEALTYDNLLTAHSCRFDLDIGRDLALRPARFTRLLTDYLDAGDVHRFLQVSTEIATGRSKSGAVAGLQTRSQLRRSNSSHRFGNCILGFTYRGVRSSLESASTAPTLTMFSRTAYITHTGCLDLAVASLLASEIARRSELATGQISFVWQATSLQFHVYKSLPLLLSRSREFLNASPDNALQKSVLAQHARFSNHQLNGQSRFGPVKRVQAVYANQHNRISVPFASLSLASLTRGSSYARTIQN